MKIEFTAQSGQYALVPFNESHIEGIFQLDSDPLVHQYLGNKPISTMEQAHHTYKYIREQYDRNGIGRWAIECLQSGQFVGWSGLKYEEEFLKPFSYYDLGYRLRPEFWKKGIATISAQRALKYGFNEMKIKEIYAAAQVENLASNHIIQKLGFKYQKQVPYKHLKVDFYKMTQEEYSLINKFE